MAVASLTQPITVQLAALLLRPVSARARHAAARRVLDWVGCAVGALRSPLAAPLARVIARYRQPGAALLLGRGRADVLSALGWNAALGNLLEMDDLHRAAILHPGPICIPVALAMTDSEGADGAALLDAVVRGYEASIRIGQALGPPHYRHWHSTATCGSFGAAAAAGSVIGLDQAALAGALAMAGSTTGGLWQVRHEPGFGKSIHNAESARRGFNAAALAREGVWGPLAILEGPQGLFAATAAGSDPAAVIAAAGEWKIVETSLKPWPACRHAHPAIDAARKLGLAATELAQIAVIKVASYADALKFCDCAQPTTPAQARFSLQHAVAIALLRTRPQLADFELAAIDEPEVARLRARVQLRIEADFEARYPQHYGAEVSVVYADGSERIAQVDDAWGDPEWPLDDAALIDKARALMGHGAASDAHIDRVVAACLALDRGGSLAPLAQALEALP